MSRSELAQSIDESTQGKVTHRQGDFNRKLGSDKALKWYINTLLTIGYIRMEGQLAAPSCFLEAQVPCCI